MLGTAVCSLTRKVLTSTLVTIMVSLCLNLPLHRAFPRTTCCPVRTHKRQTTRATTSLQPTIHHQQIGFNKPSSPTPRQNTYLVHTVVHIHTTRYYDSMPNIAAPLHPPPKQTARIKKTTAVQSPRVQQRYRLKHSSNRAAHANELRREAGSVRPSLLSRELTTSLNT